MYQLYRYLNKIAKIMDISLLYNTKVGIKSLNQLMQSYESNSLGELYLKPQELFLGFDALKDDYSLVDVSIDNAPHISLMKALEKKQDLRTTEYCKRYANGTLDSREKVVISNKTINEFEKKFEIRKKEVIEENYSPVQVYKLHGKYYIADGKHRAALCTVLGQSVKCKVISNDFLNDSFRQWIYRKMLKNPDNYSRNLALFK